MSEDTVLPLVLFDIDDVLFNTEHFISSNLTQFRLYEDVLVTLDDIANHAEIGILSQGEHSLQTKKLVETGIESKFTKEHIHIVEKKDDTLSEILQGYRDKENLYFIDDRLAGLYFAKKAIPLLRTIWLRQGRHFAIEKPIDGFVPDYTIDKLTQVIRIIR